MTDAQEPSVSLEEQITHQNRVVSNASRLFEGSRELKRAVAILDSLKRLREREWISVEDRLPGPREQVNLWFEEIKCYSQGYFTGIEWRIFLGFYDDTDCDTAPTHWQPLPEPPARKE